MTIRSVSLDSTYRSGQVSPWRSDFKLLAARIKSADTPGAQTALASFQKDLPEALKSEANQEGSPLNNTLTSLSTALQSNDLAHAQDAFASLRLLLRYGVQSDDSKTRDDNARSATSAAEAEMPENLAARQSGDRWIGRRINTNA